MNEQSIIRERLTFTGRVQGVGFRYRAKYAADNVGVTGWVTNEWDGSVVMEAQGTADQINRVLKMINQSPYIQISWLDRKPLPKEQHEKGFHVR